MDAINRTKKRLGRRIKELREQRLGIAQEQMAEVLGVSSVYVSRLERGSSSPSFKMLVMIATMIKVSLAELFEGI